MRHKLHFAGCLLVAAGLMGGALSAEVESLAARQARLEKLSTQEREDLLRKKQRFDALKSEKQEALRKLHQSLAAAPDATELERLLTRYSNWLRNLQSLERAEVLSLPPDKRIARIKEIVRKQENERFRDYAEKYLPESDREQVRRWLEDFVASNEPRIIEHLSRELRWRVKETSDAKARSRLLIVGLHFRDRDSKMPYPSKADVEALIASLSEATRKEIDTGTSAGDRVARAEGMVRAAIASIAFPPPTQDELRKFYADLPIKDRARLETMDAEQVRQELPRLYRHAKFRERQSGGNNGFRGPPGETLGKPR